MIGTDSFTNTDPDYIKALIKRYKDNKMYIREDMIDKLRAGKCRVIFTKLNGEQRDMECTLKFDLIAEDKRPKNGSTEYSMEMIRAFDLNKQEFRTFKVTNVISFSPY
jgi:WYL_2, Sm-like SH3 beta-barrel fold